MAEQGLEPRADANTLNHYTMWVHIYNCDHIVYDFIYSFTTWFCFTYQNNRNIFLCCPTFLHIYRLPSTLSVDKPQFNNYLNDYQSLSPLPIFTVINISIHAFLSSILVRGIYAILKGSWKMYKYECKGAMKLVKNPTWTVITLSPFLTIFFQAQYVLISPEVSTSWRNEEKESNKRCLSSCFKHEILRYVFKGH